MTRENKTNNNIMNILLDIKEDMGSVNQATSYI